MAKCGIERIDKLFEAEAGSDPIKENDKDSVSVGLIQDLLLGHGYKVPGLRSKLRGKVTSGTKDALKDFRAEHSIKTGPGVIVDHATLVKLVDEPAVDPVASLVYLTLKLDFERSFTQFVLTLIAAWEGRGMFAALNPNTDKEGLSFGLIQWAQAQGRLAQILALFKTDNQELFDSTFGGETTAAAMFEHVELGRAVLCSKLDVQPGAPCKKVGRSKDPDFELTDGTWQERFKRAGRVPQWQKIQVMESETDIRKNLVTVRSYADAITTERGIAFMLDLSNQHGPHVGKHKTGAKALYRKAVAPGLKEKELLEKIRTESVKVLAKKYGKKSNEAINAHDRRTFFIETPLLKDSAFQE